MVISVIIPCRNEKNYISECIEAIFDNQFTEKVELFVSIVDGLSDDGTREIISQLKEKYENLSLIDNEKKLTPFAFNLGIKAQKADFYQIVGSRQIISKNYLQDGISKMLKDTSIWCVGGLVENVFINKSSELIAKAMNTSFGMGLGNFRVQKESCFVDTVGTPLYSQKVFDAIGYFDEELVRNQDDDFNFRVTQAGGKILLDSDISIKYYVRANIQGLRKQFYQYGYWKVFVNKKHKAVTTFRQLIPPLFVLYLLLFLPVALLGFKIFLGLSIPLFLYLALAIYFAIKSTKKMSEIIQIAYVFPILHISYGFGYLAGIVDFFILNKKPNEKNAQLSR